MGGGILLPRESEKKITTEIAVAKGRKMARKSRSELDTTPMNYGMGKKGMKNIKKSSSKYKKKKA